MAISERAGKQVHVEDGERAPWVGQHMTLDEFLALPEVKPYLEYDDGVAGGDGNLTKITLHAGGGSPDRVTRPRTAGRRERDSAPRLGRT